MYLLVLVTLVPLLGRRPKACGSVEASPAVCGRGAVSEWLPATLGRQDGAVNLGS